MNLQYVIKKPIITEKSLAEAKDGVYTFEVEVGATKDQIKTAVKQYLHVDVVGIRTTIKKPVSTSTGRKRKPGMTRAVKKAIVQLKAGQTIKAFDTKG